MMDTKRDKKFDKAINSQFFQLETNETLRLNTSNIYPQSLSSSLSPQNDKIYMKTAQRSQTPFNS